MKEWKRDRSYSVLKMKNKEKRTIKFSSLLPDPFMNSLLAHDKFRR